VRHSYSEEAIQPPLYYILGAALVVGTRELLDKPLHNPIAPELQEDPGAATGESHAVKLHPPDGRWPLWPYVLRGFSILCGLGTVWLTYAAARLLVPAPAPTLVALFAAAVAALVPEMNFIRASVTNENAGALIGAWLIVLLLEHLTQPGSRRRVGWIAVAFGLGVLNKLSIGVLLLPALGILWLRRRVPPGPDRRHAWHLALPVWLGVAAFYGYRWWAYGDPLARPAWIAMLRSNSPWTLADLFWVKEPFRSIFWNSFWGYFGWQNITLPDILYTLAVGFTALAVVGGIGLWLRGGLSRTQQQGYIALWAAALGAYAMVIFLSLRLIAWQGREMYPALSAICLLFGIGLGGLALGRAATRPVRALSRLHSRAAGLVLPALVAGLFLANLYSIVWLVGPLLNKYK
jgi:hypothetical protein